MLYPSVKVNWDEGKHVLNMQNEFIIEKRHKLKFESGKMKIMQLKLCSK